jgi:hypothetical protein
MNRISWLEKGKKSMKSTSKFSDSISFSKEYTPSSNTSTSINLDSVNSCSMEYSSTWLSLNCKSFTK